MEGNKLTLYQQLRTVIKAHHQFTYLPLSNYLHTYTPSNERTNPQNSNPQYSQPRTTLIHGKILASALRAGGASSFEDRAPHTRGVHAVAAL